MPIRAVNQTERAVKAEPAKVVAVTANIAKVVLQDLNVQTVPNVNTDWGFEIAARYIFNDTGGKVYYAFGTDKADNVSTYHGVMQDQQMLDCSNHGQEVSVYALNSGNIAITILHRQDLHPQGGVKELPAQRP